MHPANLPDTSGALEPHGALGAVIVAALYVGFLVGVVIYLLRKLPHGDDAEEG